MEKQIKFQNLPTTLCVVVSYSLDGSEKDINSIQVNEALDVGKYIVESASTMDTRYELKALICHVGKFPIRHTSLGRRGFN